MLLQQVTPNPPGQWWQILPAVVQSIFWIVVGTLTFLTYRHAKNTVLQPLQTEVYKYQLDEISKVFRLFIENRRDFDGYLHTGELFNANVQWMYDEYTRIALGYIPKDRSDRPYSGKYCPESIVTVKMLQKDFVPEDGISQKEIAREERDEEWGDYMQRMHLPQGLVEATETIEDLISNPLLPSALCAKIEEVLKISNENVLVLCGLLEEKAPEMPANYPTLDDLANSSFGWINFDWARRRYHYETQVEEILEYCRKYLASDLLSNPNWIKSKTRRGKYRAESTTS